MSDASGWALVGIVAVGDEKSRRKFLMAFLGGMISKTRPDVSAYITDGSGEPRS